MVAKFENSSYSDIEKYKEYKRKSKQNELKRLKEIRSDLLVECLFCGTEDKLTFHHVNSNEKSFDVTERRGIKSTLLEAQKCWCLCEECHIKLHQRLVDPLPSTWDIRITVPEMLFS
jgi:hypothetical protein